MLSVNLSCTYVAVTLHKAELFSTAEHTDIARPSLCIKLIHAVLEVVIHKRTESVCANAVTPHIGFADIDADGTIDGLSILPKQELRCRNGNSFSVSMEDGTYRAYGQNGEFLMLAKVESGVMSTTKSFWVVD